MGLMVMTPKRRLRRSVFEKLWRCPPLAGAPGAAGSGQELTVPPGRSRHAVLKKITEQGSRQ